MDQAVVKVLLKKCDLVASLLADISHPVKLKVLCLVADEERSVAELTEACEVPQPNMSQFLARMKDNGMLESHRKGQRVFYRIADRRLLKLLGALKDIYCR